MVVLLTGACSSDDSGDDAQPADDTTTTTTAEAAAVDAERVQGVVEALADDELEGRDNQSDGSVLAQDFLVDQLDEFAQPLEEGATVPMATATTSPRAPTCWP